VRAAVLHEHGATPVCGEFAEPTPAPGRHVVEVAAAGLHHLDLHKATGTFYLALTGHAARGEIVVDVDRVALAAIGPACERQGRAAGGPKLVVVPKGDRT
jgi:D-arabinose 1-dehydrogenase-like Zn-dependent alcohol dehydrogenase